MPVPPGKTKTPVVLRLKAGGEEMRIVAGIVAGQKRQPLKLDRETRCLDDGCVLFRGGVLDTSVVGNALLANAVWRGTYAYVSGGYAVIEMLLV